MTPPSRSRRVFARLGGLLLQAALTLGIAWANSAPAAAQIPAADTRSVDLQGHRGARGLAPENSLEGFALAIRLGVSRLELDAAISPRRRGGRAPRPVTQPGLCP